MTLQQCLAGCRLIASVQASENSAVDDPDTLARLGQASADQGVRVLRLQGVDNIATIRAKTGIPCIGLIKRAYAGSDVYITATIREVDEIIATGAEIIALDGTARQRPNAESLKALIERIHLAGRMAMADCDSVASAQFSISAGADIIGTTLAGYTNAPSTPGPDLELLRKIVTISPVPVVAEGRYAMRWQVESALRIGAAAVVVGGAINDPVKTTRALLPEFELKKPVGAVDIGGTWLRFALFSPDWKLISVEKVGNPKDRESRMDWIRAKIKESGVNRIGLSTGGIVDPTTGICWTAKEYLMPDQIGIEFSQKTLGVPTYAHGDGHATAWGHACLPQFAGRRVATLALGTGVGCGFVEDGRIWMGRRGEYPRVNDLPTQMGRTNEELLGGIHLTKEPSEAQKADAIAALEGAIAALRNLYFPDDIVIGGSVGLSPWLAPRLEEMGAIPSPLGTDAGLHGAAALALFPAW